jgi:hypothetical protein
MRTLRSDFLALSENSLDFSVGLFPFFSLWSLVMPKHVSFLRCFRLHLVGSDRGDFALGVLSELHEETSF